VNFTASNSVTAVTKNIGKAGAIVDAAVGAGANTIDGPSLTHSGQVLLTKEALTAAIVDARARALTIATAAHVRLGSVLTVIEGSGSPVTTASPVAKESVAATPVEAGTIQTEEDVTVTFGVA